MITYDVLQADLTNFADKFNIPDRKGKKKETRFILIKKFEKKEIQKENKDKGENKENKEEILKGLMFENFSIKDIRKNLDYIIFCSTNRSNNIKTLNKLTEYNEVDVIAANEIMDRVAFKNMNKNYISIAFNFSEILNAYGIQRVKKLGIMKKNLQMAKKYNVNYIVSTFASNIFEYKPAEVLISFGRILGMNDEESRNAVSKNYENIIRKFRNRNNENLLTDGLEVIKFGEIKKKKKKYGYY